MLSWMVAGTPVPTVDIANGIGAIPGSSVAVSPAQDTT